MITHNLTHTVEKPFKNLECDQTFTKNSSLSVHKRTHKGEKPLKCLEGDKTFTKKSR